MFRISRYVFMLAVFASAGAGLQTGPPATAVTALTNVRIIDGTTGPAVERGTILISSGRITAAGASVQIPAGATRVDLTGKTVMPGMVNAHGHVHHTSAKTPLREDLIQRLRTYASYGVTTVVSLGQLPEDEVEAVTLRDEQDKITLDRARIYTSGQSNRGHKTPEQARQFVDRLVGLRVDRIKFHMEGGNNNMAPDVYGAIIGQAHKHGLRVAAHIFTLAEAKGVVARGVDIVAHSVRDQDIDQAFISAMKSRNVGYIPTFTREVSVFAYESTPAFFTDPFFLRGISQYREQVETVSAQGFQQKVRANPNTDVIRKGLVQATRNLKIVSDAGIPIALGTDSGADQGRWQGYFEHVELEMMVKAGLTPQQAVVAATGAAAKMSGLDHVGTIAPGKAADLLILDANPLQDIRNTRQIHSVWVAGRRL